MRLPRFAVVALFVNVSTWAQQPTSATSYGAEAEETPAYKTQPQTAYSETQYPQGQAQSSKAEVAKVPHRMADPIFLGAGLGNPSPSWYAGRLGFQIGPALEVFGAIGHFSFDEIRILSYSGGARIHILPTRLTPFVGGQFTFYHVTGVGKFQGLSVDSNALPGLSLGLDLITAWHVRAAAGFNFHFPVKLVFPFFELGFCF